MSFASSGKKSERSRSIAITHKLTDATDHLSSSSLLFHSLLFPSFSSAPLPLEVGPLIQLCGAWGVLYAPPAGLGRAHPTNDFW